MHVISIHGHYDPVSWDYYDKFSSLEDKYLPVRGDGLTQATQLVTAVIKLIYMYYNNGDIYHHNVGNDISSYANWIYNHCDKNIKEALEDIEFAAYDDARYEHILKYLADNLLVPEYLEELNSLPLDGSVYRETGPFNNSIEDDYDDEEW